MSLTPRSIFSAILVSSVLWTSACSAVLNKDEDDDGVQRCDNKDDCELESDDNRFDAACVYGEGQDDSSQKVCVTVYNDVTCSPTAYGEEEPFNLTYEKSLTSAGYVGCGTEGAGKKGCAPNRAGDCSASLEVNEDGVCDSPGADMAAVMVNNDNKGQDVLDQFCRHRFCDDSVICVEKQCRRCDPDAAYGQGGCGELYSAPDQVSTVYRSQDSEDPSCGARQGTDDDQFGPVPEAEG